MIPLDPSIYRSDNFLVVDLETAHYGMADPTAVNPQAHVLLACWWYKGKYKHTWGNELELQELYADMEAADYIVAHRGGFELGYFERAGFPTHKLVLADTKIAEYEIAGNRQWKTSLEDCCLRHGMQPRRTKWISRLIRNSVCPSTMPPSALLEYCLEDVERELTVWRLQREVLFETGLEKVFFSRCFSQIALTSIEFNGMHVDPQAVEQEYNDRVAELQQLEIDLNDLVGGINFKSPKQIAEMLYDKLEFAELKHKRQGKWESRRTPSGLRLTDADTIDELKATTRTQREFKRLIAEIRQVSIRLSKILNPLHNLCNAGTGEILYADFNTTVARTHRLSSTGKAPYNLQFQNFPNAYKFFFTARKPGAKMLVADYSQLEFNVAAFLGDCPVARADVENKHDVHRQSAAIMHVSSLKGADYALQMGYEELAYEMGQVSKEARKAAKPDTFGPLYGKVKGSKEQVAYFEWFRAHYKGVEKTQQGWIEEAIRTKKMVMPTGLVFYWPAARLLPDGYVASSTNIRNYPIQNFASAEITLPAVRMLWQAMKERGLKSKITATVHDSIVLEVEEEEVEVLRELVPHCMIDKVYEYLAKLYGIEYTLPLRVDVSVGDAWRD